jgi:hypothetical protein
MKYAPAEAISDILGQALQEAYNDADSPATIACQTSSIYYQQAATHRDNLTELDKLAKILKLYHGILISSSEPKANPSALLPPSRRMDPIK